MYSHACIKCQTPYQDTDPDRYYCPPCVAENKKIAAEIDRKLAHSPKKQPMSALQQFEATAKHYKSPDGRTITFGKL